MTFSVRSIVLVAVAGLAACIPLSRGREYSSKRVTGKQGANILVAYDTSTCSVSTEAHARVQVGENHRCVWETPDTKRRNAY